MNILIGCEFSQIVATAFREKGHEAYSCDLLDWEGGHPEYHLRMDIFEAIKLKKWDMAIFHPPCTHLTIAQAWTFNRPDKFPDRHQQREEAIEFVEALWNCGIPKIAIENPVGFLSTMSKLGKPAQIIQPHQFGEDASKATCLWLKGLPPLIPTGNFPPRITKDGKMRWANQTDSGQNKLGPSEDRWAERSKTYPGIAAAMVQQWGYIY